MIKKYCKECAHYHRSLTAGGETLSNVCDFHLVFEVSPIGDVRVKTTDGGRVILKKCEEKNFDFNCEDFSAKNKVYYFLRKVFHFIRGGYFGE